MIKRIENEFYGKVIINIEQEDYLFFFYKQTHSNYIQGGDKFYTDISRCFQQKGISCKKTEYINLVDKMGENVPQTRFELIKISKKAR